MRRKLVLKLSNQQSIKLEKFVSSMKHKYGLDVYSLISEPRLGDEELRIVFLTMKEGVRLATIFMEMGLTKAIRTFRPTKDRRLGCLGK